MANLVKIISTETIKPSSPTPNHLRTYKLSLFDQLSPPKYASIVLFYSAASPKSIHGHLKSSLSETLTHFYQLAGQFDIDTLSINCNDHGVSYIDANVGCDMSEFLANNLQQDQLLRLLPFHPLQRSPDPVDQIILGVQVNAFACGGIAVGACIQHAIADGSTLASFLSVWAAIGRGDIARPDGAVVADCSSLFPAKEMLGFTRDYEPGLQDNFFTDKFSFDRSNIYSVREMLGNAEEAPVYRPTRFEALVALIWGAMISIDEHKYDSTLVDSHSAFCLVDFRKRMEPPLPQYCIGSNILAAWLNWPIGLPMDHRLAARKIRETITTIDSDYIRKQYDHLINCKREEEDLSRDPPTAVPSGFSSYRRFPYNEVDLGFGKPYMIAPVITRRNFTVLIDDQDGGGGVEAWVALSKEDMPMFEKDPAILEYATFTPSPKNCFIIAHFISEFLELSRSMV